VLIGSTTFPPGATTCLVWLLTVRRGRRSKIGPSHHWCFVLKAKPLKKILF
jgi:hypothetical protein